jgi:hypothetical protein
MIGDSADGQWTKRKPEIMTDDQGIYVYGFGRTNDVDAVKLPEGLDLYRIESDGLAAYCRIVDLSDYSEAALKERQNDQSWLFSEAQRHHKVIVSIHQQAPLLPAKFGTAFASEHDVCEAIRRSKHQMLERLNALENRDEWAAHVYLEIGDLQRVVIEQNPDLQALTAELESASAGRKYMLGQQVQSRLQEAVEQYQSSLADGVLNALRELTVDFQVEPPRDPEAVPEGETEIARASVLVQRDQAEQFIELAEQINADTPEVWLQITGPWPAYSFSSVESDDEVVRYG